MISQSEGRRESALVPFALFALAGSTLSVEIGLTKFLGYKVFHDFTYAVISMVILSFGAAGVWVFLRPGTIGLAPGAALGSDVAPAIWRALSRHAVWYACTLIVAVLAFCWIPIDPYDAALPGWLRAAALPLYFTLLAVPFFFAGLCISATLTASARPVGVVLFWDLLGAAAGAAVTPLLLARLGGYGAVGAAAALGMLAAAAYARAAGAPQPRAPVWALFVGLLALAAVYPGWAIGRYGFDIRSQKDDVHRKPFLADFGGIQFTRWNAIARVDVSHTGSSRSPYYRYGLATRSYQRDIPGRYVLVDGGANTRQFQVTGAIEEQEYLGDALWATPYVVRPDPQRVFVVGGGGGIDILVAKYHGAREVDVAELNPATFAILTGRDAGDPDRDQYLPWLVSDDRTQVRVHLAEGRHFATTRPDGDFDVIHASGVDTLTAITSGGKSLVENYLYTVDAVREYHRVLAPDGVLSLTHWRQHAPATSLRMFVNYLAFLEELGVEEPARHLLVIGGNAWTDSLLKKSPFTREEVEAVKAWAARTQHAVIFHPFMQGEPPDRGLLRGEPVFARMAFASPAERAELLARYPIDVSPVTDDRPYFYRFQRARGFVDLLRDPQLQLGPHVVWMFAGALAAALVLVFAPLARVRRSELSGSLLVAAAFFALCGFGFLLFQTTILQVFSVFVGGPTYTLAVILVCVLAGYAGGSALVHRLPPRRAAFLAIGAALFAIFAAIYVFVPGATRALADLPLAGRIAFCAAVTLAASVATGMPVPLAMGWIRDRHGAAVGWMWGVSSAFNVLGGMSYVPLTHVLGIRNALLVAGSLYLIAAVVLVVGLGGALRGHPRWPTVSSESRAD